MLYVYAITDASTPADATGFQDAPVRAVPCAGIAAVTTEHDALDLAMSAEELWTHEGVVEASMELGAVLPMRLGSVVADEAAIVEFLRDRLEEFEAALRRVGGAVELGVRVMVEDDGGSTEGDDLVGRPGTAYMMARLAEKQRTDHVVSAIHAPLGELAREHRPLSSRTPGGQLRGAYLVERDLLETFRARVDGLDRDLGGVTIACTGPWPPYSFTGSDR